MTSKIVVNNIEADSGVSTVTFNSDVERGSSNLHSTGLNVNNTFVHSTGIALGAGSTVGAVTGVTTYYGDGSQLTGIDATKIETGNTKVETVDTGSDGHVKITTEGSERLRIINNGKIFVGAYSAGDDFSDEGTFLNIRNNSYGGRIGFSNNTATAGVALMEQFAYWGNNKVAGMIISAGTDTTNKDDASMSFYTRNGGSVTERLKISSDGIVTKPNQPSFHSRRTNNASSTANPLVYDDVPHNNSNSYKSSGTDQGKYVAPVAGVYLFYWCAIKTNAGSVCRLYINKNGSKIYGQMHLRLQESGTYSNGSMQAILSLAAGDKVHISLEAGSIHGSEYTHFGGYLIG